MNSLARLVSAAFIAAMLILPALIFAGETVEKPAKPVADHCHSAVDPFIAPEEKRRFFRAAGKDGELSSEEFSEDLKRGNSLEAAARLDEAKKIRTAIKRLKSPRQEKLKILDRAPWWRRPGTKSLKGSFKKDLKRRF